MLSRSWPRVTLWFLHLAIPMAALWLLVRRPAADARWEHHQAHFGLVLITAAVNVVLGVVVGRAAVRHDDTRLFLVSLGFVVSAGFLGLHALATPGVLLPGSNAGFDLATSIGLLLAGFLSALSSVEFGSAGLHRRAPAAHLIVAAVLIGWGVWSLSGSAPLNRPLPPADAAGPLLVLAFGGSLMYAVAAARYFRVHRRRPSVMLISIVTAFVLLAEAMFAVAFGRNWHASWWEWHVLMTTAFGLVAYSAFVEYRREGSPAGLFRGVALERTIRQLQRDEATALDELTTAMRRSADGLASEPVAQVAARLGTRFGLTEGQVAVLEQSARALGHERTQRQRLSGLVRVAREARVIRDEEELLDRAMSVASAAFAPDQLELSLSVSSADPLADEALRTLEAVESTDRRRYVVPLDVKRHAAGVLTAVRAHGAFDESDRSLLRSLASQLSIVLENARLYRRLEGLFRSYLSPDVATALLADPAQAGLGGEVVEVSVLIADLSGFTPFAERAAPDEVVGMLNRYFDAVVPVILAEGGTVLQFVGDEVLAVFNAPVRQSDHALRAARAGLRLQQAATAAGRPGWPRFRVGISTGPALVGNIGTAELRNFAVIGDTTNLAARLQATAAAGEVVISRATSELVGSQADVRSLGSVLVKGKASPVEVFVLRAVHDGA
ncbi:adenylate/guanylate cyclase domain-containing protein [Kribbella capetownensis]|uniref:Adenylate/guanylate cyclase domain-containing protein n=1 Tax=Kribbella capetownensis TaxID=1572659 RepID=A0A4R0JUZ2_9ACTN|nr:adenylate/guanylate cyclase domain-containing protein [Kribbella capetownensis]TCC48998.1 adenylate/guanylate cyclase domain-containing protein [Kribbella capetownensis]